jgi:MSHA biogenesis protein MshM
VSTGARLYLDHFGLLEAPFTLTPNTGYFLASPAHREALNLLLFALRSGEGFVKITGEVGTGKTLLCRKLICQLADGFESVYVPHPPTSSEGLLAAVAEEMGLEIASDERNRVLRRLAQRLIELDAAGRRAVLVIDEAHVLPEDTLEAVRLLTNLETERQKLLQVVLFGQPELDQRLAQPGLRQLRQRISFAYRLRPLSRSELGVYVEHRLRVAGSRGESLFASEAIDVLQRASGGIPRLVNVLGNKALLAAWGHRAPRVLASHVRRAAADTEGARRLYASPFGAWLRPRATG